MHHFIVPRVALIVVTAVHVEPLINTNMLGHLEDKASLDLTQVSLF